MPFVLISIAVGILSVLVAEWLWLKDHIQGEASRKFIHVFAGSIVATWPFFISYKSIILLELCFIGFVAIEKKLHIFHGAKQISRLTWGEFWYPTGLVALALMNPTKWVFVAAALHLAIADAAAAMVGTSRLGKHKYKFIGHVKSIEGSAAFFAVSAIITTWVIYVAPSGLDKAIGIPLVIFVAAVATVIENIGIYGTDNLLIPIFVAFTLMSTI